MLSHALLITFNSENHTAVIKPNGSSQAYLEGIAVAKNIPVAEMLPGRNLAVLSFDRYRAAAALVIAVW